MKRFIALLACILALTACGNQSDSDEAGSEQAGGGDSSASTDTSTNGDGGDSGAEDDAAQSGDAFANDDEKRSYALGMDIGNSLQELPVELNVDMLAQGVRDTIEGNDTRLSQEELDSVMQGFVKDMEAAQQDQAQEQARSNQDKGEQFLAENKDKEGVETTDSGLQYKVLEEGDGPTPSKSDSVTVHYTGELIDGTVFDSSRERGEPVTFPVDAVIPGWTEALQLMKEGAKYELYIPADLAYGERGAGAQIGPNETLIFDVELIEVDDGGSGEGSDGAGGDGGDEESAADASGGDSAGEDSNADEG